MSKICLIDGSGFIFRAFHALPPLHTKDGLPVNAVYGFAKSIMALHESRDIEYIAVIFDASRITFRQSIYKEYKAHRPPAPEDLIPQFPLIKQLTEELHIKAIEKEGFEADDLIATYTKLAAESGIEVEIISSDKDLMQLIDDAKNIHMFDAIKSRKITSKEVLEKFNVTPDKIIDLQALMGDSADNVPGVRGVGPKGGADLINTFGSLDLIYSNIDSITKKALKENLINNKALAYISKELVTLKNDVPIDIPLEDLHKNPIDPVRICNFFQRLSFNSLAVKTATKYGITLEPLPDIDNSVVGGVFSANPNDSALKIHNSTSGQLHENIKITTLEVENLDDLNAMVEDLKLCRDLPILFIFNATAQVTSIRIFSQNTSCNYMIDLITQGQSEMFEPKSIDIILFDVLSTMKSVFENPAINKIFYNLKPILHILNSCKINLVSYNDLMQMAYLTGGHIAEENPINEHIKKHLLIDNYTQDSEIPANLVLDLYDLYQNLLIEYSLKYIYEVFDRPLLQVLMKMESTGILVDSGILQQLSEEFAIHIKGLEVSIYSEAKLEFNIGSPKQLGEVLFEKMRIKGYKSKTGSWKTDASVLEELAENGVAIANLVLKWRQLSKLKNTYTDKLPEKINPITGRIHTTFLPCATSTARLSSIDPNLQNIPIKSEEGRNIRRAFVTNPNYKILSLDYSQIELRVLAAVANVKKLILSFNNNEDIHKKTASEMFDIPIEKIDSDLRRQAKAINFGIIYGQTVFGLSSHLGISREKAKLYIESYFTKYPEIKTYMLSAVNFARENGFVKTLFGRRCFVPGINSTKAQVRNFAERAAINAIIQGTASDIMRKALIDVYNFIQASKVDIKILLQIHDELLLEGEESILQQYAPKLKFVMENSCDISIKLAVDYNIADSWLDS